MINMMKDILQYLPYALFMGAIFLLLFGGLAVTVNYFAKKAEERRKGKPDKYFKIKT
jgi:hypothetical protein